MPTGSMYNRPKVLRHSTDVVTLKLCPYTSMQTITAKCVSREVSTSCWSLMVSTVKKSRRSPTAGTCIDRRE